MPTITTYHFLFAVSLGNWASKMSEKFRLDRKIGFQNTFNTKCINVIINSIGPSILLRSIYRLWQHFDKHSVSYYMVCAHVREDYPRALASGLSPVHAHNHTITASLHQHACALCAL